MVGNMNSPVDFAHALLGKARDDGYVLKALAVDAAAPDWILGFHAQQAIEKALKAVLARQGVEYPRTHNLAMLLELLRRQNLDMPPDADELGRLTPFGVALRYDEMPDESEAVLDREWTLQAVSRTISWAATVMQ